MSPKKWSRNTVSLGAFVALAGTASAQPFMSTYTTCDEFGGGNLAGAVCDEPGQLVLDAQVSTLPILWVANAGEDTFSKWDTDLNVETARYHTWFGPRMNHGAYSGPAPSRTSVDLEGNVFVANRHFDGRPISVVKIFNEGFVDRNGNGVEDTSRDIDTSGDISDAEMFQHADLNGDLIFQQNEINDERIAWIRQIGPAGGLGRCLAIDGNGDLWVGAFNRGEFYKMDGQTGDTLGGPYTAGASPYGAVVDRNGILWGSSLGSRLIKFDTNNPEAGGTTFTHGGTNYGIGIGVGDDGRTIVYLGHTGVGVYRFDSVTETFDTPFVGVFGTLGIGTDPDGNVVVGRQGGGSTGKWAPDGTALWITNGTPISEGRGTIADSNGDVWTISRPQSIMTKFDGETGDIITTVNTGRDPYTYSDATGIGLRTSFPQGFWTINEDSGCADTCWDTVSWDADVPDGTSINFRARSSNDLASFSAWEDVTNGDDLTVPNARYLQVEARLQVQAGTDTPTLFEVDIAGEVPSASIDIAPSRSPNPIIPGRNYTIYVAVLGNDKVDAAAIDWNGVRFGPQGSEATPVRQQVMRDINGDGMMDALFGFRTNDCGFEAGNTTGTLTWQSPGGCTLSSTDSVVVINGGLGTLKAR